MLTGIKRRELFNIFIMALLILVINMNPIIVNAAVYNVSSNIEKYRVGYETQKYMTDESEHFIYKYTESDKDIVYMVKDEAEKQVKALSKIFGYEPKEKITIIIFADIAGMNETLHLPQNQSAMGLYTCGFVSVLSPKVWIADKKMQHVETIFKKSGPMAHELTHYFIDKRTKGNYPMWFTEGVALYYENQLTGFEWGRGAKYTLKPYTASDLTNNFDNLDNDFAYRRSFEIIRDYVNKNGEQKLMNIMDRLGEGYTLEEFGN